MVLPLTLFLVDLTAGDGVDPPKAIVAQMRRHVRAATVSITFGGSIDVIDTFSGSANWQLGDRLNTIVTYDDQAAP